MLINQVKKLTVFDRWVYWISERESIRLKKENLSKGSKLTDDEILTAYRFCNVRRADDKVSQWLIRNWYNPHKDHPNVLTACAIARFFNKPESLELITKYVFPEHGTMKQGHRNRIKEILRKRKAEGHAVFNGAYMVRGMEGEDKLDSVLGYFTIDLSTIEIDSTSMEVTWSRIMTHYGMGSFMAGQIVADLRYAMTGTWRDRYIWAPMGPGSKRGMNRLKKRELTYPLSQEQFLDELREMKEKAEEILPQSITERLEMIDWQSCLCEYDKYSRALEGDGRPKQLYKVHYDH